MNNLKLKLFEFKKNLTIEQQDVSYIVEKCFNIADTMSEIETANILKNKLQSFSFYENVSSFLDDVDMQLSEDKLLYELKDTYTKLDRKNHSAIYRAPLITLLEIINTADNEHRLNRIITELSGYDWIDEIKTFMWKFNNKPEDRVAFSKNGGLAEDVFTIMAKVSEGALTFVKDKWFLINKNVIKNVLLEDYIKDINEIKSYRLLEEAVKHAYYENNSLNFRLDDNLVFGVSTKNDGKLFLNGEETEGTTTLETIFASPIVPFLNRNYYPVINETANNIKKFVALNIVKKVTNILNPYLESYVFNFENNMYVYRLDTRGSNQLFKYENASALIADIKKEFDYDITEFFKDKVSEDIAKLKDLEAAEIKLTEEVQNIEDALNLLAYEEDVIGESVEFKKMNATLLAQRHLTLEELKNVKNERIKILNLN